MKNTSLTIIVLILIIFVSCASLTSTTKIEANNSFILGNNKHGKFNVKLKNVSDHDLEIHYAPIDGGTHSYVLVKPSQQLKLNVDKNTALVIENKSADEAIVSLLVKGDTGLSMGYQK